MKWIGTLIISTLMISLVGCRSAERVIICNEINNNTLGVFEICEFSWTFNQCRCKKIDLDNFKEVSEMQDYPLSYCDGVAGFKAAEWGKDIGPKLRALSRLKVERCEDQN